MEIVHGLPSAINTRLTILTIGAFDGVHRGHQHLIGSTVRRARQLECQSAALTFDPHPDMVMHPERERMYLTSFEERAELIEALGVDLLIVLGFTRELMTLPAAAFMAHVCQAIALRELWIGWDFALGRRREGTLPRLREIGHEQADLLRDPGIAFVVRSVALEYLKPARLDDLLTVTLEVEKITRSQIFFRQHILRGNALAADGWDELISGKVQIVCVSVDAGQMKVTSIPSAMRSQLEALQ